MQNYDLDLLNFHHIIHNISQNVNSIHLFTWDIDKNLCCRARIKSQSLSPISYVTLRKLLNLSKQESSDLYNEDRNIVELWRLNTVMHVAWLPDQLA